jgi:hypothetical protein
MLISCVITKSSNKNITTLEKFMAALRVLFALLVSFTSFFPASAQTPTEALSCYLSQLALSQPAVALLRCTSRYEVDARDFPHIDTFRDDHHEDTNPVVNPFIDPIPH